MVNALLEREREEEWWEEVLQGTGGNRFPRALAAGVAACSRRYGNEVTLDVTKRGVTG